VPRVAVVPPPGEAQLGQALERFFFDREIATHEATVVAIETRGADGGVHGHPVVVERDRRQQRRIAGAIVRAHLHDRTRRVGDDLELQFLGKV
jgi:hypothetical protein